MCMDLELTKEYICLYCLLTIQHHFHPSPKVSSDFYGQRWKFYFPESFLHMILSQSQAMEGLTHDLETRRERETIILWSQLQMSGSPQLPVRLLESIHVSDPHWDRWGFWKFLKLCNYSCKLPEQPLWWYRLRTWVMAVLILVRIIEVSYNSTYFSFSCLKHIDELFH